MSAIAPISDAELLKRYEKGNNETAFRALVERYQGMVVGTAFRRTGNVELAREVAQEVFAALARKARFLTGRASIGGWLHQAAIYQAARAVQSEARRHARQELFAKDAPTVSVPVVVGGAGSDRLAVIDEALDSLSGADREVLILHYFQDLSYPEMARILGVNEAAVRQRVSRAVERLGKRLREQGITGNVVMLLLGAVAVQSSIAAPAGLAGAALAAAAAGGGYSAYLLLMALLSQGVVKTTAVVVAVAGMTALWHGTRPEEIHFPENAPLVESMEPTAGYAPVIPTSAPASLGLSAIPPVGQSQPVRGNVAVLNPRFEGSVSQTTAQNIEPPATRASSRVTTPPGMPVLASPGGIVPSLAIAGKGEPGTDGSRSKDSKGHPSNSGGSPGDSTPLPAPSPGSPDYRFPGILGVVETLGGLPAVIAELRDVEQVPREAAKLYGELLEDVLSLELGKVTKVEDFLEEHFEQLNEKGIAGVRPPEIVEENWRALREESVEEVVDGVQTILADVAPDPKLIEDVFALVEKPESEVENSEPESGGLLPLEIVEDLVPTLPKIKTPVKLL